MIASVSKNDTEIIGKQLGRIPRGLKRVASRCAFGCPQAIETEVFIKGGKPFPTLYWLTCPLKVKAVSQLEDEGWSGKLNDRLTEDQLLRKKFLAAQEDYKTRRINAAEPGALKQEYPVFKTGVGGVGDLNAVKCLHAHYAHFLAGGKNPIGEMVDEEIKNIECKERCR